MHLKILSAKWQPFCLVLNVLTLYGHLVTSYSNRGLGHHWGNGLLPIWCQTITWSNADLLRYSNSGCLKSENLIYSFPMFQELARQLISNLRKHGTFSNSKEWSRITLIALSMLVKFNGRENANFQPSQQSMITGNAGIILHMGTASERRH